MNLDLAGAELLHINQRIENHGEDEKALACDLKIRFAISDQELEQVSLCLAPVKVREVVSMLAVSHIELNCEWKGLTVDITPDGCDQPSVRLHAARANRFRVEKGPVVTARIQCEVTSDALARLSDMLIDGAVDVIIGSQQTELQLASDQASAYAG